MKAIVNSLYDPGNSLVINQFEYMIIYEKDEGSKVTAGLGQYKIKQEIKEWCCFTYGKQCYDWAASTNPRLEESEVSFYFKNEQDRALYLLRWGHL